MVETDKLRVLLPHWIEHNADHAEEFRSWAERAGVAREALVSAAEGLLEANVSTHMGEATVVGTNPLKETVLVELESEATVELALSEVSY